ncbi:MAG TPA: AAA family ATPase [Candidatus Limnocylindria bacterium]
MPASPALRIQLLGRFAVLLPDGRRAGPWARPTARRLVQLLALRTEHRIGREELADILFPELSPASAANAVAKALSMARSAIGPVGPRHVPALEADRGAIWLSEQVDVEIDLEQHAAAFRAALALTPGEARDAALVAALANEATPLAEEPYADWAVAAREELEELRATARLELARNRAAGHGESARAAVLEAWSAVAAHQPTSEEAAMALMRLHVGQGQRDSAIRAYVRCVQALRDDLDVGPSDALEGVYAELITRGRASQAPPVEAASARPLFGRASILKRVRRRLTGTPAGRGPALLLVGPTGIGKSRILGALGAELAVAGWVVLSGRSVPDDRRAPYAALRQALDPLVERGDVSAVVSRALGVDAAAASTQASEPAESDRLRLAEEVGAMLDAGAAQRPLALALDDVQWADPAMHGLLRRLAARPGPRRWSLLLAARSDEPDAPVPDLGSSVEEIPVATLDQRATAAAVRAALAEDGQRVSAARVSDAVERSRGNPFFAIELARTTAADPAAATVPEAIVELLRRRLGRVSAASRTMISIVALAGGDATHELVLATLPKLADDPEPLPAHVGLDELIGANLVLEEGHRLALVHPLLRDAASATVNAIRRSAIHAAIADTLEALDTDHLARMAAARHRLSAYEATRISSAARPAAEAGFAAGHLARHVHAPEVALGIFEAALDAFAALPANEQRTLAEAACAAWLTIGNIHLDRDDDHAAERAYRRALEHARLDADVARAWSALAGIPYRHGDMPGALAAYRSGLASLSGTDTRARARLESDSAWALTRMGRHAEALEIMERVAPELLQAPETHLRCRTKDRLGLVDHAAGRVEEGLAWLDDGVADATAQEDDRELAVLCLHRGGVLAQLGRHDDAEADLVRAAAVADAARDRYLRSVIHWNMADLQESRGQLEDALAERDAEVALLREIRNDRNLAGAEAHRARLLTNLARHAEAAKAAEQARLAAVRTGDERLMASIGPDIGAFRTAGKNSGTAAP